LGFINSKISYLLTAIEQKYLTKKYTKVYQFVIHYGTYNTCIITAVKLELVIGGLGVGLALLLELESVRVLHGVQSAGYTTSIK